MMSALAMILTAAMVVPGDGPKYESAKIVQRLDLSGKWKGYCNPGLPIGEHEMNFKGWGVIDEGAGRVRLKLPSVDGVSWTVYGIYEQDGDRLKICFSIDGKSRPTRFDGGGDQYLYDIRRVKSSEEAPEQIGTSEARELLRKLSDVHASICRETVS